MHRHYITSAVSPDVPFNKVEVIWYLRKLSMKACHDGIQSASNMCYATMGLCICDNDRPAASPDNPPRTKNQHASPYSLVGASVFWNPALLLFVRSVGSTVAAGTQISGIISRGADEVPWNLIAFIIPGVVIGGQLAPRLQGRLSQRTMEKLLAGVFGAVGTTFATISVKSLLAM